MTRISNDLALFRIRFKFVAARRVGNAITHNCIHKGYLKDLVVHVCNILLHTVKARGRAAPPECSKLEEAFERLLQSNRFLLFIVIDSQI